MSMQAFSPNIRVGPEVSIAVIPASFVVHVFMLSGLPASPLPFLSISGGTCESIRTPRGTPCELTADVEIGDPVLGHENSSNDFGASVCGLSRVHALGLYMWLLLISIRRAGVRGREMSRTGGSLKDELFLLGGPSEEALEEKRPKDGHSADDVDSMFEWDTSCWKVRHCAV